MHPVLGVVSGDLTDHALAEMFREFRKAVFHVLDATGPEVVGAALLDIRADDLREGMFAALGILVGHKEFDCFVESGAAVQ